MDVLESYKVKLYAAEGLVPYDRNSRTHSPEQIAQIRASMREWGWTNPLLIDEAAGGLIIAGHGRTMAALEMLRDGEEINVPSGAALPPGMVPGIDCSGWSDEQRRAYIIADNKLALNAGWDLDMLKLELVELRQEDFDLGLIGFDMMELADMLEPEIEDPKCDPDEIPDPAVTAFSKLGDMWICGDHRVICGDATDPNVLDRLLDDGKADHCFTDPPYLMNFVDGVTQGGKGWKSTNGAAKSNRNHAPIANDKMSKADGEAFLRSVCAMIKAKVSGTFYISFYRGGIRWILNAMHDAGLENRCQIIWKKNNHNLSNSDYKSIFEPVFFGFADDYHSVLYGWNDEHIFRGGKGERDVMEVGVPSVWEIAKTKKNTLHPTVKPVALVERAIKNSSLPEQVWLDLFGGSGTTLIACQTTGRRARLVELEPAYVDVIARRYHAFTGKVPVHAVTGEPFPIERFEALPEQR